jgi:NADPH2:quinone reductase
MQQVIVRKLGKPAQALLVEEVETPQPRADEALVRMRAGAINFPDILMTEHKYQFKPPLPFIPGTEGAGDIIAVGDDFQGFALGDRVVVKKRYGIFAECVTANLEHLLAIPKPFDYAQAAAFSVIYNTAYNALVVRGKIQAGERLLVLGAAGGVGMAAVELGVHLGADVIAVAGDDSKLAVTRDYGAAHCINYETEDLHARVMALTDGHGADVIYDPVGGAVFEQALRCCAWQGRLLVIGFTSGGYGQIKTNYPLLKGCSVIGCRAGEWGRNFPEAGAAQRQAVIAMANDGVFHPHISHRVPLEDISDAYALLSDRKVVGKAVVTM